MDYFLITFSCWNFAKNSATIIYRNYTAIKIRCYYITSTIRLLVSSVYDSIIGIFRVKSTPFKDKDLFLNWLLGLLLWQIGYISPLGSKRDPAWLRKGVEYLREGERSYFCWLYGRIPSARLTLRDIIRELLSDECAISEVQLIQPARDFPD